MPDDISKRGSRLRSERTSNVGRNEPEIVDSYQEPPENDDVYDPPRSLLDSIARKGVSIPDSLRKSQLEKEVDGTVLRRSTRKSKGRQPKKYSPASKFMCFIKCGANHV